MGSYLNPRLLKVRYFSQNRRMNRSTLPLHLPAVMEPSVRGRGCSHDPSSSFQAETYCLRSSTPTGGGSSGLEYVTEIAYRCSLEVSSLCFHYQAICCDECSCRTSAAVQSGRMGWTAPYPVLQRTQTSGYKGCRRSAAVLQGVGLQHLALKAGTPRLAEFCSVSNAWLMSRLSGGHLRTYRHGCGVGNGRGRRACQLPKAYSFWRAILFPNQPICIGA